MTAERLLSSPTVIFPDTKMRPRLVSPTTHAALGLRVGYVVGRCTQEEVIGIAARRVVALVADEQPIGDRTDEHLPCGPVRLDVLPDAGEVALPVAASVVS